MPTLQIRRAEAIEFKRQQRRRIADTTDKKGRGYRRQEAADGGRIADTGVLGG